MRLCRCKLMKEIQTLAFAAHETALFLDGHPNDRRALAYFNMQNNKLTDTITLYEKNFGPLTPSLPDGGESWTWISGPWPWEYAANVCEN